MQASGLDTEPKARILLKAVEVGLKIVEVTDLEKRLTALENSTNVSGNNDSSELETQRGVTA